MSKRSRGPRNSYSSRPCKRPALANCASPLGAYEKARIYRFLNEVNPGRMTFDEAQHAIGGECIAAYGPTRRLAAWRGRARQ